MSKRKLIVLLATSRVTLGPIAMMETVSGGAYWCPTAAQTMVVTARRDSEPLVV